MNREAKSAWRITHRTHATPHAPNMQIQLFLLIISKPHNFLYTLNSVKSQLLLPPYGCSFSSTYGNVVAHSPTRDLFSLAGRHSFAGRPQPHHSSVRHEAATVGALRRIRAGLHTNAVPVVLRQPQAALHAAASLPLHAAKQRHFERVSNQ